MTARGLTSLSLPDLEVLRRAVGDGRLPCPLTTTGLVALGFRKPQDVLSLLGGLPPEAVCAAVNVAIAERVHRRPPHLDLVWTGPEASTATARDTWVVVRQLFERAQRTVLVAGFSFDHGAEILRPLHQAMVERHVDATLFLDIEGHATDGDGTAYATAKVDRFFADNWPFGSVRPAVFYDPRTAVAGPPWASLHAKCVVVDDEVSFLGSANFTDRGQTRNIEAGVLIEDVLFARALHGQWRGLISQQLVHRYT
jgi:hypothetical protein